MRKKLKCFKQSPSCGSTGLLQAIWSPAERALWCYSRIYQWKRAWKSSRYTHVKEQILETVERDAEMLDETDTNFELGTDPLLSFGTRGLDRYIDHIYTSVARSCILRFENKAWLGKSFMAGKLSGNVTLCIVASHFWTAKNTWMVIIKQMCQARGVGTVRWVQLLLPTTGIKWLCQARKISNHWVYSCFDLFATFVNIMKMCSHLTFVFWGILFVLVKDKFQWLVT